MSITTGCSADPSDQELGRGTRGWLADARSLFAARILAAVESAPDVGVELLLGCQPVGQARELAADLQHRSPSFVDPPELQLAAARLRDPERLAELPVGRLLEALELPAALGPHLALMALAEHDARLAPLFGYLNDDAQRRYLTVALAERLAGPFPVPVLELLAPEAALRTHRIVEIGRHQGHVMLDCSLRLSDSMARWLLGDHPAPPLDAALDGFRLSLPSAELGGLFEDDTIGALVEASRSRVVVLLGATGSGRGMGACALSRRAGREPLLIAGERLAGAADADDLLAVAVRDATLRSETLVIADADELRASSMASVLCMARCPVLLTSRRRLEVEVPHVAIPPMDRERTRRTWRAALGHRSVEVADQLAHRFRLPAVDIFHIASEGGARASPDELSALCVDRSARTLEDLASRLESRFDWSDLVLPQRQTEQLRNLEARVHHAHHVFVAWGFGEKLATNRGLVALFSGPSGAGKTLSAGILARAVGLPLYRVDLSTTVSKYIGETEKNLESIFRAAEAGNACLFFDECDALFAKRSEVNDAHDRYANIETSYLLQRLETHRGIVMMASNHPQNIDDAFTRRIDVTVDFPMPDAASRAELWRRLLPVQAGADIDAELLGSTFELAGGSIRNCLLGAAFIAAADGVGIDTRHCIRAVAEEYKKLDKPLTRAEFGDLFGDLRMRPPG